MTGYSWEEDMGMVMGSETEGQRFLGRERELLRASRERKEEEEDDT